MSPRLLLAALLLPSAVLAQTTGTDAIRRTVEQFVIRQTADVQGSVTVDVGRVVESAATQSCTAWEAFLPPGARVWKAVTVGVRCTQGANASLYVPTRVRIDGPYVVMARPVSGGQVLTAQDMAVVQGEVTAQPNDVITRVDQAVGQSVRQALSDKQALRGVYLKTDAAIQAGQTVKIITEGDGFSVVNEGRALNTAARGQVVRVKLTNNRVLNGIARDAGVVAVALE
ncbi:MAG: flagellar basal body P-ring formation chaperone FlgA [Rhodocyclaceae bacterium]